MGTMIQPMIAELKEEAGTTKRVLERVPPDKLTWKPHAKSMTLGQLALHIATVPAALAKLAQLDSFDVTHAVFVPPQPKDLSEILGAYDQSLREAEQTLQGMTNEYAGGTFRLMKKDKELFAMPRTGVLRSIMLNHWYHHRGQLSVYLRLLDVPVPVIYGRSADEDPFA